MELPIPKPLKNFWESWEIRAFILFSLFLQSFLILFSPLRKRFARLWMYMSIWSAYLLADWVASFAVGLISSSQNNASCNAKKSYNNPDIFAYWASFLLSHLGGPDTITAFALEDNELWRRHMLTLVFQSISAVYVFYQSLPKNPLWMPTLFMFCSGIIKYGERTYSLYCASLDTFRDQTLKEPDAGPSYAKLMNAYYSMKKANMPTSIKMFPEPKGAKTVDRVKEGKLEETEVVLHAYRLFETFKGLIVDSILSLRDRELCRNFFLKRTADDAFKVIEAELNFIYDTLFTKARVVYRKRGFCVRFVSSSLVIASLAVFYFEHKKEFRFTDIAITYTLLLGAIALDAIALIMYFASDWLTIMFRKLPAVNIEGSEPNKGDEKNTTNVEDPNPNERDDNFFRKLVHFLQRRWSETVWSYNLIYCCRHGPGAIVEKIFRFFLLEAFLNHFIYLERKPFTMGLRQHIFNEVKRKSETAEDLEDARMLSKAKGNFALEEAGCSHLVRPYIEKVDYDQSLLLWHLATELCYHDEDDEKSKDQERGNSSKPNYKEFSKHDEHDDKPQGQEQGNSSKPNYNEFSKHDEHDDKPQGQEQGDSSKTNYKEFSKLLSDYMLYLLIMQPTMMSTVAGIGQIRFRDTCADAKKFFREKKSDAAEKKAGWREDRFFKYLWVAFKCLGWGVMCPISPLLAFMASLYVTLVLPLVSVMVGVAMGPDMQRQVDKHYSEVMKLLSKMRRKKDKEKEKKDHEKCCKDIMSVPTEVRPGTLKGEKSKSVFFDAAILAKELQELEKLHKDGKIKQDKWEIISKVWVEMLSYAAINCRANAHAQQLARGGELLTVVWLLMVQFGLGTQFQIDAGHERAKLNVRK